MSDQIDGFARCGNAGCEAWDQDCPIPLVRETVAQKGHVGEAFAHTVITESEYVHPADDADIPCPECGMPRALVTGRPVAYPKAVV